MYESFNLAPNPIVVINKKGVVYNCNDEFSKVFKVPIYSIKNKKISFYIDSFLEDMKKNSTLNKLYMLKNANKKYVCSIVVKKNSHKNYILYLDIKLDELCLGQYIKYFNIFIDKTPDYLYIKKFNNGKHEFQVVSQKFANLCGYEKWTDLIGLDDFDVFPKKYAQKYYEEELNIIKTENQNTFRQKYKKNDGSKGWISTTKTLIKDKKGRITGLFGISRDISQLVNLEKQLIIESQTDELTNAFNKKVFKNNIKRYIVLNKKYNNPFTLLLLDIDDFKKINDKYGHLEGDIVLKNLVTILNKCVRKNDSIYRIGGDEFAAILPTATKEKSLDIIRRVMKIVNNKTYKISLSIGLSEYKKGERFKELFKRCDDALYKSKNNGKNQITVL